VETDADVAVHCTSIYHPTLHEAMSKVMQRIMPHASSFEHLLNAFVEKCNLEKAILMDTKTKLVVCVDTLSECVADSWFRLACDIVDLTDGLNSVADFQSEAANVCISFDQEFAVRLRYLAPTLALVFMTKIDSSYSSLIDHNMLVLDTSIHNLLRDLS